MSELRVQKIYFDRRKDDVVSIMRPLWEKYNVPIMPVYADGEVENIPK
jgi:hypothetical protein